MWLGNPGEKYDETQMKNCSSFRGWSYCELQSFVEQAVALAVEEGIGASCLGYSYPGQAGFL